MPKADGTSAYEKDSNPAHLVGYVLAAEWWHKHKGVSFDPVFFVHPANRLEEEQKMEKVLYDRWGQFGLGAHRS